MNSTVISRIKSHVKNDPNKIIVMDRDRHWSWKQLLSRANDYSSEIQKNGLKKKIIPIIVDRSGESIAAIIGCLISGNGFAPLSGNQPQDRITKCLSALEVNLLLKTDLTHSPQQNNLLPSLDQLIDFNPGFTIYNLFTSGSTGTPKGVLVSAGNIENTMLWSQDYLNWNHQDVMGCASNFFFDISMFDFFSMVYFNIPLAIFSQTTDPEVVIKEINQFNISSIFSVPLFFTQLSRLGLAQRKSELKSLRQIISGGDFFPPIQLLNWMNELETVQIYNVWGPTETSIVNTMHLVTTEDKQTLLEGKSPAVGLQHHRMPFVLVNENRNSIVTKPFETGEVTMLGECVTQGYLNSPELTAMNYGKINNLPAFFTQDLGYINEAGELFIQGRLGSMVKISGYRVDLGEIEFAATNFENIYLACPFVKKISEEIQELWLVVELKNKNTVLDIFSFKNHLRAQLPHYMVPKRIFVEDFIQKNENGKIDRNKVKLKNYE